jgi:hypothetical protein
LAPNYPNRRVWDTRHGGPYDRGGADAYYSRPITPHYFTKGTYSSCQVNKANMTEQEIEEYAEGYNSCTERKNWG